MNLRDFLYQEIITRESYVQAGTDGGYGLTVKGIVGVFNKTEGLTGSSIKSLLNSVKDFARHGLAKVELQAIGVINKDLEKRLLEQGFQRTTVIVDGQKVDALTKTISVR